MIRAVLHVLGGTAYCYLVWRSIMVQSTVAIVAVIVYGYLIWKVWKGNN